MSENKKKVLYRFRKNVTVDDMALDNAKSNSKHKRGNAVGNVATTGTRHRVNEHGYHFIDLTDDQDLMLSGRDDSETTEGHNPENEAESMTCNNNNAIFATLSSSMVFEHQTPKSMAMPPSGTERAFIHTTYPNGTTVRTPYAYTTPTDKEAEVIRRQTKRLMARRHATMSNGRGRAHLVATVAGPLQPFSNSMAAERAAIDAVARSYMVNSDSKVPARLQARSDVSGTHPRVLTREISGDQDLVLDSLGAEAEPILDAGARLGLTEGQTNDILAAGKIVMSLAAKGRQDTLEHLGLDGPATAAIKKLMDLKSNVESIVETSKASQGANVCASPELGTPGSGTIAAMNTAGDTKTFQVCRYLILFVFPFDVLPVSLGRTALFLPYTFPCLSHCRNPHSCHRIFLPLGEFAMLGNLHSTEALSGNQICLDDT